MKELGKVRPDREKYIGVEFVPVDGHPFTRRQTEALVLLAKGLWQWGVAERLEITRRTVKERVTGIFDRLEEIDNIRPEPPNHWIAEARERWLVPKDSAEIE